MSGEKITVYDIDNIITTIQDDILNYESQCPNYNSPVNKTADSSQHGSYTSNGTKYYSRNSSYSNGKYDTGHWSGLGA